LKKKGNNIGWCDKTANPVWGCPGNCPFECYARSTNDRFKRIPDFSKPHFSRSKPRKLRGRSRDDIKLCMVPILQASKTTVYFLPDMRQEVEEGAEEMNTDIVKALREDAKRQESLLHICDSTRNALKAAALIESLQAQLTESQRRERAAAVSAIGKNPDGTERYACPTCGRIFWERGFVESYCPSCGQALICGSVVGKGDVK
jgi:hypothetical protein